jgi:hypothetical protein
VGVSHILQAKSDKRFMYTHDVRLQIFQFNETEVSDVCKTHTFLRSFIFHLNKLEQCFS